jgi:hypothetical protein
MTGLGNKAFDFNISLDRDLEESYVGEIETQITELKHCNCIVKSCGDGATQIGFRELENWLLNQHPFLISYFFILE